MVLYEEDKEPSYDEDGESLDEDGESLDEDGEALHEENEQVSAAQSEEIEKEGLVEEAVIVAAGKRRDGVVLIGCLTGVQHYHPALLLPYYLPCPDHFSI